jgi:hypothetical protein
MARRNRIHRTIRVDGAFGTKEQSIVNSALFREIQYGKLRSLSLEARKSPLEEVINHMRPSKYIDPCPVSRFREDDT